MIPLLASEPESPFPPTAQALENPPGLLAAGGDLSPTRLLNAYRHGIFPWYSGNEPILWWSPAPRCVIYPEEVYVSRRLRRRYNQQTFSLTADQAFEQVITACAVNRGDEGGTWITAEMLAAYVQLHKAGIAHSVEVWCDETLVGGIYGLALGRVFFGESMFSHKSDASKVALVVLCQQLVRWKFTLLDCQISNPHLLSMGAVEVSRELFEQHLTSTKETDHWLDDFKPRQRW